MTHDATLRFSPSGQIYGGIIRLPDQGFLVVRGFPLADRTLVPILTRVPPDTNHIIDQPDLEMTSNSRDEVAIGENDGRVEPPAPTASVDESYNAGDKTPTFQLGKVDKRSSWFDLPPTRVAAHRNGTIYAAFIAIHGYDAPSKQMIGDIVVVRGRRDANTHLLVLADLVDRRDRTIGNRIETDARFPYDPDVLSTVACCLGQQRYQASLSIAIDPMDSAKVYLAWADLRQGVYTLHVRSSTDSGSKWSEDIWAKPSATNPALAVDDSGVLGFLFQQVTDQKSGQEWVTELERSGSQPLILAKTPALEPTRDFDPYIGDYVELHAVGKRFYGVFSANNTPDRS